MRRLLFVALFTSAPLCAAETISYSYDARGRLVKVQHSGTANDGIRACYIYDKADNRSKVTVAAGDCEPPAFWVSDSAVGEGGDLVLTVTKTGTTSGSSSVSYSTANGSAVAGADFNAVSGTLNFAQAETTKSISVATIDDAAVEGAETLLLNLSGASGGPIIRDAQGVGTINDDEAPPPPAFAIGDASATEGGNLVLTVTKVGAASTSYSVNFATASGSAAAGSDYASTSGTLIFAAAETSKTITISTTNDTVVESAETVLVNLSGATGGATISDGLGVGTINDNDVPPAAPSFSINDKSGIEGSTISFTVTKSGTASSSHSVSYSTADGTATASNDYYAASGTLTFGINDVSKTITINLMNGLAIENDETFTVNLSNATGGATISDAQGIGTIYDDDDGCPPGGCPISPASTTASPGL